MQERQCRLQRFARRVVLLIDIIMCQDAVPPPWKNRGPESIPQFLANSQKLLRPAKLVVPEAESEQRNVLILGSYRSRTKIVWRHRKPPCGMRKPKRQRRLASDGREHRG